MNDKILIDRELAEQVCYHLSNNGAALMAEQIEDALAASPAAQEGNASAYLTLRVVELEQKWEALNDACLAKDRRITELAAELLGLRTQDPVMVLNYDGVPEWMAPQWGGKRTPGTMFYVAAGAKENSK